MVMLMVEGQAEGRDQARGPMALDMPRSVGKPWSTQHREQGVARGGRPGSVGPGALCQGHGASARCWETSVWRKGLREELGGVQGSGPKVGEPGVGGSALR